MKKHIYILLVMISVVSYGVTRTSTASGGNWNSSSTWVGGIAPGNNDDAVIAGNVTVNMELFVHNLTINSGKTLTLNASVVIAGTLTNSGTLGGSRPIKHLGPTITSTGTGGDWNTAGTWSGGVIPVDTNSVVIAGTVTIGVSDPNQACNNLTINSGKSLTISHQLIARGQVTNNGTLTGSAGSFALYGNNMTILTGSGTFTFSIGLALVLNPGLDTIASNVTYSSSANVAFGTATLASNMTLVNLGSILLSSSGTLANTSTTACKWINGPNSTVKVSSTLLSNSSDTLVASATGNLIEYAGSGSYTIKKPLNSQYNDVTIIGSAVALGGNYNYHTLTVNSGGSFNLAGHNASLTGNWVNHGTISNNTGTVTFDAVGSQCVLRTSGTESFTNINITRTSQLGTNCTVSASGTVYMQPGGSMDCTCP